MSEAQMCDCILCHNGLGRAGRKCDCFPATKTYVIEDDMDDRTNLDAFLEKTRVAMENRPTNKKKVTRK